MNVFERIIERLRNYNKADDINFNMNVFEMYKCMTEEERRIALKELMRFFTDKEKAQKTKT